MSATKPKAKPKVRAPEEVWYDVHKHPAGVPGGMGKSPEYHLRGRGWSGHEINEGSGKKTIQYRNLKHPDFVVSYGGGTSTKPDHNFRVLYMGTNNNIPRVTRAYSVAEAMDKVEELHGLHTGLVVQPMTHAASRPDGDWEIRESAVSVVPKPSVTKQPSVSQQKTFVAPAVPPSRKDMTDDKETPIGPPKVTYPTTVDREIDYAKKPPVAQLVQIPPVPKHKPDPPFKPAPLTTTKKTDTKIKYAAGPGRTQNDHGTLAGRNRHKANSTEVCPLCRKAGQVYGRDPMLYRDLIQDSGGLTEEHLRTSSPFHDKVQVALTPRVGSPPRHPEGQGPADLGRAEYQRQYRKKQRAMDDADVARLAEGYGMSLDPSEVANYRGLRGVVSAFQRAERETWEEA